MYLESAGVSLTTPLEGNFDILWAHVIDTAFLTPQGVLNRKEKTSPLSTYKFDGLYIGGCVEPQEWLVIEVARALGEGTKQQVDRHKVIEHGLKIVCAKRRYLMNECGLSGRELVGWLRRFPVWGIVCQGVYMFRAQTLSNAWCSPFVAVVYCGCYRISD